MTDTLLADTPLLPPRQSDASTSSRRMLMVMTAVSAMLLATAPALAQDAAADKDQYTLFNPTPRALMRELAADRPDATESPVTVDAGHVQLEMSFFDFTHDDNDGVHHDAWTIADTNIKVGLTNDVDLQLVLAAFTEERDDLAGGGPTMTREGFGDVTLRLKWNLWGNDPAPLTPQLFGAATAFGVMPFVKIPTGTSVSNGHVEGGVILMFGWDVADNWGLGFMAEFDAVYDDADDDYDGELLHTVVVGFDIAGPLGGYAEYAGIISTDGDSDYLAFLGTGLTYALSADAVLDLGARIGLTDNADDIGIFTGITWRF